jgi:hypothetical protein
VFNAIRKDQKDSNLENIQRRRVRKYIQRVVQGWGSS